MPILKVVSSANSELKVYLKRNHLVLALAQEAFDKVWLSQEESIDGLRYGEFYLPESLHPQFKASKTEFKDARTAAIKKGIFQKTGRKTKHAISIGKSHAKPDIYRFVNNDWAYLLYVDSKSNIIQEARKGLKNVPPAVGNIVRTTFPGLGKPNWHAPGTYQEN